MSNYKTIITAGFAMFSMFYGSGNLVFPLLIGKETLSNYPYAFIGLFLTAVIVPFLGLFGMILYNGNYRHYFSHLGRAPSLLLIAMMLCIMGPFGVVPRCITVAYGGLSLLSPGLPPLAFSAAFCLAIAALIWRQKTVIDIIGMVLTPFKLGGIVVLVVGGLMYGQAPLPSVVEASEAFSLGFFAGYKIMDLIAAFFFSSAIVTYLRTHLPEAETSQKITSYSLYSSLIGALLLFFVYMGFVILGAKYGPLMHSAKPEELLGAVAYVALGRVAVPIITITLAVGCLATAVILTTLFVDFLRKDISHDRLSRATAIGASLVITLAVSQLGFSGINRFLGMILEITYPALIVYAILCIISKMTKLGDQCKFVLLMQISFWLILSASALFKLGFTTL